MSTLVKKTVPLLAVVIIGFVLIPYCYHTRELLHIYRWDIYLFWICGAMGYVAGLAYVQWRLVVVLIAGVLLYASRAGAGFGSCTDLLTVAMAPGLFVFFRSAQAQQQALFIVKVLFAAFIVQVHIGLRQAYQNDFDSFEIRGGCYNSGYFSNYLAAVLPMVVSLAMYKNNSWYERIIYSVYAVLGTALVLLCFGRSAVLGLLAGTAVMTYVRFTAVKTILGKYGYLFIPVVLCLGVWFIGVKENSALGRVTIWKICLLICKDHPVWGVGAGNFSLVYNTYQAAYFRQHVVPVSTLLLADNTLEAFNLFLQVAVEYGLAGIAVITCAAISIWQRCKGKLAVQMQTNALYSGCAASVIAILVAGLFSNPFHCKPVVVIGIFCLACMYAPGNQYRAAAVNSRWYKALGYGLLIIILALALTLMKLEDTWYKAYKNAEYGNYRQSKASYEQLLPFFARDGQFLYNYGVEAYYNADKEKALVVLQRAANYVCFSDVYVLLATLYTAQQNDGQTEACWLQAIYMVPKKMQPRYALAQWYVQRRQLAKARQLLRESLALPLKINNAASVDIRYKLAALCKSANGASAADSCCHE